LTKTKGNSVEEWKIPTIENASLLVMGGFQIFHVFEGFDQATMLH
jgi:hypothetical protein